jgi:hypothetical protein
MKPFIIQPSFILKGFIILIVVLSCCILLDTCSNKKQTVKPQQTELKHAIAHVNTIEKQYEEAIGKLKIHNGRLEKELTQTKEQLVVAKIKQAQSKHIVIRSARKDTVGKNPREQLADCDSLKAQVIAYVNIVDSAQCLYEKNIGELHHIIQSKDEEIALCNTAYTDLKTETEESFKREQQVTDDLKKAYKKERRKNFSNKLLGVGVIVLTAVSGLLYVNTTH